MSNVAELLSAIGTPSLVRITLQAGRYQLGTTLSVYRSLTLEAAVPGSVVLDAGAGALTMRRVLEISPGDSGVVEMIGLNITGGSAKTEEYFLGGGILVTSGQVFIRRCRTHGNSALYGGGIGIMNGVVAVENTEIDDNIAQAGGAGLMGMGGSTVASNCDIKNNHATNAD